MARPKGSKNTNKNQTGVVNLADIEPKEQIEQGLQQLEQVLENVQQINNDFQERLDNDKITLVDVTTQQGLTPEQVEAEVIKSLDAFEEGRSEVFVDPILPLLEQPTEAPIVEWPFVVDGQGKRVPASLVSVKSIDFNVIIKQWLYIASLGGELNDKVVQQLDFVPYWLHALIPADKLDHYNSNPDAHNTEQEGINYLEVMVSYPDRYSFLNALKDFGRDGAFVSPRSRATARPFNVSILTRTPFMETLSLRRKGAVIKYSEDELKNFSLEQLRIVAGWYDKGAKGRDKATFIKEILKLQ